MYVNGGQTKEIESYSELLVTCTWYIFVFVDGIHQKGEIIPSQIEVC